MSIQIAAGLPASHEHYGTCGNACAFDQTCADGECLMRRAT
jgi:hypothetical protein